MFTFLVPVMPDSIRTRFLRLDTVSLHIPVFCWIPLHTRPLTIGVCKMCGRSGPKVIKLFSMLNSAEHEFLPTNKKKITDKFSYFLVQFGRV